MNITLIIMCVAVVGYLGSCVVTWRRLSSDDDKAGKTTPPGGDCH